MRRLIIRPGAIGDTILSLPAMEHLRAEYTEVWVRSCVIPLIDFADRVRSIASTGIERMGIEGVEPSPELVESLGSFDEIVTWYGANRAEFRAALGSLAETVTFQRALPPEDSAMHAADYFLRQVGGAGAAIPRIAVGPVAARSSIVFHPFSGSQRKNWPMARFLELERELGNVEWAARPDWVRFEDLMELAKWIAGAKLYVGNDSGITHLAAAAGARVIALFGPTNPDVWGPRGTQVKLIRARSMEEISISMLRAEIAEQLQVAAPGA